MAFDLNLLLTFEAMDKARSVSGAARILGLSQPATSAALSRLRRIAWGRAVHLCGRHDAADARGAAAGPGAACGA
jgi:hypothetical protein